MNKSRRKEINDNLITLIKLKNNYEMILSNEEDSYDNIPENLQSSSRAIESEDAIDSLNEAIDCLQKAIDNIDNAIDFLSEI